MAAWTAGGYDGPAPPRGFRCNWDGVKQRWRQGASRLDVFVVNGRAAGFLNGTDILEVRPDHRGRGYGRILAEYMIALAREEGLSLVAIEIAPASAKPFWEHMGFTLVEGRKGPSGGTLAYLVLERRFELPGHAPVAYSVDFFTEKARYSNDPSSFARYAGVGERLEDGRIQLAERAFCFASAHDQHTVYFVRIAIKGVVIHFDKANDRTSTALGLRLDAGDTYFIDAITPLAPVSAGTVAS